MSASATDSGLSPRAWLAAALRDGVAPPCGDLHEDELLRAAGEEGVLALLEWRLREGAAWPSLTASLRESLSLGARAVAAQWLLRQRELQRLASTFRQGGFRVLLLKGSALGLWLYPLPHLRMGGDIDLLLASRAEAERAVQSLRVLDYELVFMPGLTHYEMTCRRMVDGVLRSELDLHCRLVNAPAYAELLDFDELWDAGVVLDGLEPALRGLMPQHALLHACMNRALDMQNAIPDRLKLLYDMRLFCERFDDKAWQAFVTLAESKGLRGVALRSLLDARAWLGADVPETVLSGLHAGAGTEVLDHRRLEDWRYMQVRHWSALPNWRMRVHWLRERLIPSPGQLRELHGQGSWWAQVWRRLRLGLARLR